MSVNFAYLQVSGMVTQEQSKWTWKWKFYKLASINAGWKGEKKRKGKEMFPWEKYVEMELKKKKNKAI